MGKNTRRQLTFKDEVTGLEVSVDSQEEVDFFAWCEEAKRLGVIASYQYQPPAFELSDAVSYVDCKGKTKTLLREHVYTADFKLVINPKFELLAKFFKVPSEKMQCQTVDVWLDVKGTFQRSGGGRTLSINQKWVWQRHGVYVQKTVPKEFFAQCGCPKQCFLTQKTKKPRTMYAGMKGIPETFGIASSVNNVTTT